MKIYCTVIFVSYPFMKITSIIIGAFILILYSCSSKPAEGVDKELLQMAMNTDGFVWFMHSDSLMHKSDGSTHPRPWLRTRFNSIAAKNLDENGRVTDHTLFPEGSFIVKEMFDKEKNFSMYSVLYKDSTNEFADKKGWVWSSLFSDGTVAESSKNMGTSCINCHAQENNIDFILMNKFYP